jgi:hypothetical protein
MPPDRAGLAVSPRPFWRVPIPSLVRLAPGGEAWLTVTFSLAAAEPWAPKGLVLAWDQFRLPMDAPTRPGKAVTGAVAATSHARHGAGTLKLEESDERLIIRGKGFAAAYSRCFPPITRRHATTTPRVR